MENKEIKDKIVNRIWDLRRRIHLWNFIFGKDSSQSKVDEFTQYFTNWINYELQECLETRILIDLRGLLDQSSNEVTSMYKIFDKSKLKNAKKAYKDIEKFVNNKVAHKNDKVTCSYTFKDVDNTLNELQKLIGEYDKEVEILWDVTYLMGYELDLLYEKVQKVNEWEKQKM